jgi:hypothetical protein
LENDPIPASVNEMPNVRSPRDAPNAAGMPRLW